MIRRRINRRFYPNVERRKAKYTEAPRPSINKGKPVDMNSEPGITPKGYVLDQVKAIKGIGEKIIGRQKRLQSSCTVVPLAIYNSEEDLQWYVKLNVPSPLSGVIGDSGGDAIVNSIINENDK